MKLKTAKQIGIDLGITNKAVLKRFSERNIIATSKNIKSENLYNKSQIKKLDQKTSFKRKVHKFDDVVFYPMKTTENYFIYESKMN